MMLLRSVVEGKLLVPIVGSPNESFKDTGESVEFRATQDLMEAAVLSMALSASLKRPGDANLAALIDCTREKGKLSDDRFLGMVEAGSLFPAHVQGPLAWARRMFECLVRAYRSEQEDVTRTWVLGAIRMYRHLCGFSFPYDSDSLESIGPLTELLHAYLDFYRYYGVLQVGSLGAALAQHFRIQDLVPSERRTYIEFGKIELPTCPVDLLRNIYLADSSREGLEAIHSFADVALLALEAAESIAYSARRATRMVEFLPLAHEGALVFHAANTALGWILDRYQAADRPPPDDLWKEKQVAEEHRVEVRSMLDSLGGSLIKEPITHFLSISLMARRSDPLTKNDIRSGLLDGCARNPFYPEVLVEAWSAISEEVPLGECRWGDSSALSLAPHLEKRMCDRLSRCFEDEELTNMIRLIQDQWYLSECGYRTA
jgi:hypothetical protein